MMRFALVKRLQEITGAKRITSEQREHHSGEAASSPLTK
jgi:hypothetical protein